MRWRQGGLGGEWNGEGAEMGPLCGCRCGFG
jgi:hypothetical protein